MDSAEEARDYDRMDHREVNRRFVEDFRAVWPNTNPILDVGTGTAQIPIELCRQAPQAEVLAIDLAESMLALARENVAKARLEHSIQIARHDAKSLPFPDATFAAVISNSIVHHVPEPKTVFHEMVRVCRPGGVLFVRDLMRPETRMQLEHLVNLYAADANDHQRLMFASSLHAALTLDEVRQLAVEFGFDPNTVRATSDRHWTWCALRP